MTQLSEISKKTAWGIIERLKENKQFKEFWDGVDSEQQWLFAQRMASEMDNEFRGYEFIRDYIGAVAVGDMRAMENIAFPHSFRKFTPGKGFGVLARQTAAVLHSYYFIDWPEDLQAMKKKVIYPGRKNGGNGSG